MGFPRLSPGSTDRYILTVIPVWPGTQSRKRRLLMHDLRWIRENPEEFDRGLGRRGLPPRAAEVLAIDPEWRALQTAAEEAQSVRNRLSREVGMAKKRGEAADSLLAEITQSKESEAATLSRAAELRRRLDDLLATLPNLPAPDVPDGADESANVE